MTLLACALLPLLIVVASLHPAGRRRMADVLVAVTLLGVVTSVLAWSDPAAHQLVLGHLVDDPTSRLFVTLVDVIALGVALYVRERVAAAPALAADLPRFGRLVALFLVAVDLAALSAHLLLTWAFIEASALAATPLVCHLRRPAAVRAAWRYLLFSSVGLGITLLGFGFLAEAMELRGGPESVTFLADGLRVRGDLGVDVWRRLGLVFIAFGYAAKLGLAPMHAWLPETYDQAPPSVTALIAGVQSSAVFLALIRLLQVLRDDDRALVGQTLLLLGLMTMVVSTLRLATTDNYKRLLAAAAMTHNGIVAVGLGVGEPAAFGVILYLASNALVKALLFLTCGTIKARYRTKSIAALAGIIREMPWSGAVFMVGTFALLGFAPFGSFLGEVMIVSGLFEAGQHAVFLLFCVSLTITLVATGRSLFPMIWGRRAPEPGSPRSGRHAKPAADEASAGRHEPAGAREPAASLVHALPAVVILFALGLYQPGPVNALLRQVAATLGGPR